MFSINSAHDFYAMVVADFDEFMGEPHSARKAVHCAIAAYHLHEWVWAEISADSAVLAKVGVHRKIGEFRAWIDRQCPWFFGVQAIANGTKHFGQRVEMETSLVTGFGNGPFGVGPFGKGYLLIDWGEGAAEHRFMPAARLLEVVVRFWRDFFRIYLPEPAVPASHHHVD